MGQLRRHRHFWPITVAITSMALTMATFPAYASWVEQFHGTPASTTAAAGKPIGIDGTVVDEAELHTHDDPATKNAVSRASQTEDTKDPTTVFEALSHSAGVVTQRAEPDPELVPAEDPAPRATEPPDRYAMAGGCYALQAAETGRWIVRAGLSYQATGGDLAGAEPFHFQATDLGTYLLYGTGRTFMGQGLLGAVAPVPTPGAGTDWTVEKEGSAFTFTIPSRKVALSKGPFEVLHDGAGTRFVLRLTTGCEPWPEVETGVSGAPFKGTSDVQEVRGYLDAHTHGMAFEFLGGDLHCGRPWHPYGVTYALKDCPDHTLTGGSGALLENVLKKGTPVDPHDTVGWPTFKDWPAPDSLTHEGTYYKWLERSWRGGQRVFVNLLVENNQLCKIWPIKHNSCDDMDSIRLQAADMRKLERYVDAQNGGPGKGWYRIVEDPFEARKVINEGKLAVIMGIETSAVFGCSSKLGVPTCTTESISKQLDEVHDLGVRQMELVNKFDNALAGVAGDVNSAALLINAANFLETGSFWDMRTCPAGNAPGVEDREQVALPQVLPQQDALFGAIAGLYLPIKLPVYASGPHCNARGLTDLGDYTIEQMAQRKMIFDPDHMSVKARSSALDVTEKLDYPGVVSSHSWSTPDAYPRIYRAGGVITPYAGDSSGFIDKWRQHLTWADPRYYFGFGFGADINGLGAQGNPRGADAPNPVTYPFTGLGGVTIDHQVSGQRSYDINVDGVSHYGLYPDWIEDLRQQGGDDIVHDMERGSEAYLQMWERAEGVGNDACRDDRALKPESVLSSLAKGTSVKDVLLTAGQPHERLGSVFTYCVSGTDGAVVRRSVTFAADDTVSQVSGAPSAAPRATPSSTRDRIELPAGWQPEGITTDGRNLFSGSRTDGSILKIDPGTGRRKTFPGARGRVAVGIEHDSRRDVVWVAGGAGQQIRAQDADTGKVLRTYRFPSRKARFVNDLTVTDSAVYATDSLSRELLVVPLSTRSKALPAAGRAEVLPLKGDLRLAKGNDLNGIVSRGRTLVAVQSSTGRLFTIDPRSGRTRRIATGGRTFVNGDGLELGPRGTLYVVQNRDKVTVLRLNRTSRAATVVDTIGRGDFAAGLDVPSTVARVRDSLYVVNARFGVASPETAAYWIARADAG